MDGAEPLDAGHVSEMSEVYEALDSCIELERALGRLARSDAATREDWNASRARVHRVCTEVEQRLQSDA